MERSGNDTARRPATALALLQLAAGGAAAALLAASEGRGAALLILVGGLAGAAAAAAADRSRVGRAAFLTEGTERLFDAAVLGSIAWPALSPASSVGGLALSALATGAIVAYLRARGRGLGYAVPLWPWYRAIRCALLAAGLSLGLTEAALWATLALDGTVGGARWAIVARQGTPA